MLNVILRYIVYLFIIHTYFLSSLYSKTRTIFVPFYNSLLHGHFLDWC